MLPRFVSVYRHYAPRFLTEKGLVTSVRGLYKFINMASRSAESVSAESSDCSESLEYSSDTNDESEQPATSGYAHEPEYTESEIKKLPPLQVSSDISDDSASDEDLLDSSRMENLHWCKCMSHCVILHTLIECKCCREYAKLLGSKLNNIECITQHEEFHTLVSTKLYWRLRIFYTDGEIKSSKNLIKCPISKQLYPTYLL